MPDTTRTFKAAALERRRCRPAAQLVAQPGEQHGPHGGERDHRDEDRDRRAGDTLPAPRITVSGSRTSASTPCATTRSPGRPIDTGNDFVQPSTSCSAAATRTIRAASTAPSYSEPKKTRTRNGIATMKTGTATTIDAAAASM